MKAKIIKYFKLLPSNMSNTISRFVIRAIYSNLRNFSTL
jgi:hypothetical protein